MKRRTKEDVINEIAEMLEVPPPRMSTGSTEPKEIFLAVDAVLGMGLDVRRSKPELAKDIVEADGLAWGPEDESRGSTVTLSGLEKVAEVVRRLTR